MWIPSNGKIVFYSLPLHYGSGITLPTFLLFSIIIFCVISKISEYSFAGGGRNFDKTVGYCANCRPNVKCLLINHLIALAA